MLRIQLELFLCMDYGETPQVTVLGATAATTTTRRYLLFCLLFSGLWSMLAVGVFMFTHESDCRLHATFEGLCFCHMKLPYMVSKHMHTVS